MKKFLDLHLFPLILLLSILSYINTSKFENDYIIESIQYNQKRTSVSVNIKYNKNPAEFSILNYELENPRVDASIKLIQNLIFEFEIKCNKIFHYTIRDRNNQRSEPEYYLNENMEKEFETFGKNLTLDDIGFSLPEINKPFSFSLKDEKGDIYYYFDGANFLYTDTLIIFEQLLTTKYIYGFGERNYDFNLDKGRYTIWGNDTTYTNRDKRNGGWNLMGHQPVGLHLTKNKKYLGLLFLNANCQDVIIKDIYSKLNNNNNFDINNFSHVLSHITIGGIINYYITLGDTAEESILGLHSIYGHPTIPPFWSLGWHQCRWGYKNTAKLKEVRKNYLINNIPLDALWTDIDMMDQKRNFILSKDFIDVPDFINYLHINGQHFIPLVDYGIPKKNYDPYYNFGLNKNAFLYSNFTKEFLISFVWPGDSVFPDFFLEEGINLWKKGLTEYDNKLNFDGMWIDMNEPAMIGGQRGDYAEVIYDKSLIKKEKNIYLDIPYLPGENKLHKSLSHNTISVNAYSRKNNPENNFYTMYNVKSLISKIQVKITNEYLNSVNKRPFIVSRANTIGHGKYAFHWLGDNISTFEMLRWSISGIFNYNIFGIPFSGSDICGFHRSATDELCARWHILGSFYPFSRNHNVDTGLPQEPWEFGLKSRFDNVNDFNRPKEGYTLHAAKIGIKMRYSLMRYAYTQFMLISLGKKGAYFKPGFFEFKEDDILLNNMEVQNTHIMVGDAIYFIPCLNKEQNDYKGYFPNANFNSIINFKNVFNYKKEKNNKGDFIYLNGNMTTINAFLLGGKIIPMQNTEKVLNSKDLRETPINLIINPDQNKYAKGNIIFDNDGNDVIKNKDYLDILIIFEENVITFKIENKIKESYKYNDNKVKSIILLRADELEISNIVSIFLKDKQFSREIELDESNNLIKINFNEYYEIENFQKIIFKQKSQNNEEEKQIDAVLDNQQDENKNDINDNNNKEINKENKEDKENKINEVSKENKENKENKEKETVIKENPFKLILVKIFILLIFFLLSVIIILFVRIKSLQKRKANYIELTGLDSV